MLQVFNYNFPTLNFSNNYFLTIELQGKVMLEVVVCTSISTSVCVSTMYKYNFQESGQKVPMGLM